MVLSEDHELAGRQVGRGVTVGTSPVYGVLARVDEAFPEGLGQVLELAEVLVVAASLSG